VPHAAMLAESPGLDIPIILRIFRV
jgi:hypothetical protein